MSSIPQSDVSPQEPQDHIKIIRAKHDASTRWFITARQSAQDSELSFLARGILWYLLSKPDNWEIRPEDIQREGNIGRDATKNAIKELQKRGYLTEQKRYKDHSGHWAWTPMVLHEIPPSTENTSMESPSTELPSTVDQSLVNRQRLTSDLKTVDIHNTETKDREQKTEEQKTKSSSSLSSTRLESSPPPKNDDDDFLQSIEQIIQSATKDNSNGHHQEAPSSALQEKDTPPNAGPPPPARPVSEPPHVRVVSYYRGKRANQSAVSEAEVQAIIADVGTYNANNCIAAVDQSVAYLEAQGDKLFSWSYVHRTLVNKWGEELATADKLPQSEEDRRAAYRRYQNFEFLAWCTKCGGVGHAADGCQERGNNLQESA